jgi:DNA-binding NtrC family response regulator
MSDDPALRRSLVVLVLEDVEALARALARALEGGGHVALLARTADEARAVLAASEVHVVLADYGLPGGETGLDVLRFCRDRRPDVGRILMSGVIDPCEVSGAGWFSFLAKPFDVPELLDMIARCDGTRELPPGAPGVPP